MRTNWKGRVPPKYYCKPPGKEQAGTGLCITHRRGYMFLILYMYSDSRIENMTKEELLDAMKELSNVLLRRGTATDLLPYDVPMFSVKTLYNTQDTCSELEAGLCNYLNFESFTCSDTEIVGQTIPVTGLTREKLAALFTCGNPMANVCQNSALNLTSWECI